MTCWDFDYTLPDLHSRGAKQRRESETCCPCRKLPSFASLAYEPTFAWEEKDKEESGVVELSEPSHRSLPPYGGPSVRPPPSRRRAGRPAEGVRKPNLIKIQSGFLPSRSSLHCVPLSLLPLFPSTSDNWLQCREQSRAGEDGRKDGTRSCRRFLCTCV